MDPIEPFLFLCSGACLFAVAGVIMMMALLHYGNPREENSRLAEVRWQAQNKNTDWWLDIKTDK